MKFHSMQHGACDIEATPQFLTAGFKEYMSKKLYHSRGGDAWFL
jgi:hypothetical protein